MPIVDATGPRARQRGAAPRSRSRRWGPILEAAARVFAERGYHGASTQDIADRLGIRQASLYYYFASKEEALEIVCTHGAEDFFTRARDIAAGPGSAPEKLECMIRAHLAPIETAGHFMKVFLHERKHLPRTRRRRIGTWSRGVEREFEAVIREGVTRGELRAGIDPRLATLSVLGMLNAALDWYETEGTTLAQIGDTFSAILLDGLCRRSSISAKPKRER